MFGAVLGDIIGSRFEFDNGGKTKNFDLLTDEDDYNLEKYAIAYISKGLILLL